MDKMNDNEIQEKVKNLNGWTHIDNSIQKEYEVNDFTKAVGLVTQIGILAEKADHHPDILLHSWNKVKITLSSHDAGGVTGKDFDLAEKIEKL